MALGDPDGRLVKVGVLGARGATCRVAAGGEERIGAVRRRTRMPPVIRSAWRMTGGAVAG